MRVIPFLRLHWSHALWRVFFPAESLRTPELPGCDGMMSRPVEEPDNTGQPSKRHRTNDWPVRVIPLEGPRSSRIGTGQGLLARMPCKTAVDKKKLRAAPTPPYGTLGPRCSIVCCTPVSTVSDAINPASFEEKLFVRGNDGSKQSRRRPNTAAMPPWQRFKT